MTVAALCPRGKYFSILSFPLCVRSSKDGTTTQPGVDSHGKEMVSFSTLDQWIKNLIHCSTHQEQVTRLSLCVLPVTLD